MSGFEFLIRRRQDPRLSAIPVVMLSSRTDEQHPFKSPVGNPKTRLPPVSGKTGLAFEVTKPNEK